jgi:dienelactone hydrolase
MSAAKQRKKLKHQEFTCSRNQLRLRGSMFHPAEGERFPIAVVSHEFMANRLFTIRYARLLASLGYAAFCYDFSGGCIGGTVFSERKLPCLCDCGMI